MRAALHPDETARLDALSLYFDEILVADEGLQELAQYVSDVCGTPVSLVSVVEENRQRFLADVGFGAPETTREVSFCAHAILGEGVFEVPDAAADPRFEDNELVTGEAGVRFYAGVPIRTAEGLPIGALCVLDRVPRRLDDFQKRTLDLLGRQVESKLELLRKVREAEEASRAKSLFLANMSHELRTPLNAILGYSEMLQEEAVDLDQPHLVPDLQRINSAGGHLLALINDILDISKVEAGKMELYVEEFDVATMLDEVASTIAPLVERNANVLEVERRGEMGSMRSDLTKLIQCLFNLLSNAAKFTKEGRIGLKVWREGDGSDEPRTWMVFRVSDTGIGMSEEGMSRLFQAFVQAEDSTSSEFGGTGLGLALTRRFCGMMGGEVTVESVLGEGSTFTMKVRATI